MQDDLKSEVSTESLDDDTLEDAIDNENIVSKDNEIDTDEKSTSSPFWAYFSSQDTNFDDSGEGDLCFEKPALKNITIY